MKRCRLFPSHTFKYINASIIFYIQSLSARKWNKRSCSSSCGYNMDKLKCFGSGSPLSYFLKPLHASLQVKSFEQSGEVRRLIEIPSIELQAMKTSHSAAHLRFRRSSSCVWIQRIGDSANHNSSPLLTLESEMEQAKRPKYRKEVNMCHPLRSHKQHEEGNWSTASKEKQDSTLHHKLVSYKLEENKSLTVYSHLARLCVDLESGWGLKIASNALPLWSC